MKTFMTLIFGILLTIPSFALAQDPTPVEGGSTLKAGTMSLVFSFGDVMGINSTGLTSGQFLAGGPQGDDMDPRDGLSAAYGIGGRYYLSEQMAVRGTFALQSSSRDFEGYESSYFNIGIGGGIMYHLLSAGKVTLYTGGLLGMYMGTIEEENQDDVDITGVGLYGLLGAEYYISPNLSLGAEYMLGFTSTSVEEDDQKLNFTDISVQTFSFYLGFHF